MLRATIKEPKIASKNSTISIELLVSVSSRMLDLQIIFANCKLQQSGCHHSDAKLLVYNIYYLEIHICFYFLSLLHNLMVVGLLYLCLCVIIRNVSVCLSGIWHPITKANTTTLTTTA